MKAIITSVKTVVPTKGPNAGKTMFLINGDLWSSVEPGVNDTFVYFSDVEKDGKVYRNCDGFGAERLTISDKIATLTQHDAAYSSAIALLLK